MRARLLSISDQLSSFFLSFSLSFCVCLTAQGTAPCPLCRQEFSLNNLISIKLEESDKCKTCQAGGIQDKRKSAAGSEVETEAEALRDAPSHCKAVEEEDYTSIPLPAEGMVPRDARFPALSRWLAFMSHASAARCKTFVSPKHAWLRNLLGELEKREKVVIFSQVSPSRSSLSLFATVADFFLSFSPSLSTHVFASSAALGRRAMPSSDHSSPCDARCLSELSSPAA